MLISHGQPIYWITKINVTYEISYIELKHSGVIADSLLYFNHLFHRFVFLVFRDEAAEPEVEEAPDSPDPAILRQVNNRGE